jgi:hypothetical protein
MRTQHVRVSFEEMILHAQGRGGKAATMPEPHAPLTLDNSVSLGKVRI